VAGSDDFQLRVYNYNTSEKITVCSAAWEDLKPAKLERHGWKSLLIVSRVSRHIQTTYGRSLYIQLSKFFSFKAINAEFLKALRYVLRVLETFLLIILRPFVLTASDDMLIKLWDWDKGWKNVQVFEGHSHYVMVCDSTSLFEAVMSGRIKICSNTLQ